MNDLVLHGGTVVLETGVASVDVGILDGRIAAIGPALVGRERIDCTGLQLLPGGVDNHCHIAQKPTSNGRNADDFASGTSSAAVGGTTTVICFAKQEIGEDLRDTVAAYRAAASAAVVDHAFHVVVSDPSPAVLSEQLPALVAMGVRSFKVFMTYEGLRLADGALLAVLDTAKRLGALVAVHAENDEAVRFGVARLVAEGRTEALSHALSRPSIVEAEAVTRAIMLSEVAGQPIHVFHVTGALPAAAVAAARARGVRVYAETCTHYLTLTDDRLRQPMAQAARFICSPPLRPAADRDALWDRLADGTLQMVSSDHSPYRIDDPLGKLKDGPDTPFNRVSNGMPGLATRLPVLYDAGVATGRLDLPAFARLTATNPARLYGLYPRKGAIAVGADADIAVWDPGRKVTLTAADLLSGAGYTPYEGETVTGWPVLVLSRGAVVARDGRVVADPGRGVHLPRGPYELPDL
jgi:dihydropyrimidinase